MFNVSFRVKVTGTDRSEMRWAVQRKVASVWVTVQTFGSIEEAVEVCAATAMAADRGEAPQALISAAPVMFKAATAAVADAVSRLFDGFGGYTAPVYKTQSA